MARAFSIHYLKGNALKLVINLTRLPGRHAEGQCDRRETLMVGENQPRDQPSKLEGGVWGGGEGERPEGRLLLRGEWEKRTLGRRE